MDIKSPKENSSIKTLKNDVKTVQNSIKNNNNKNAKNNNSIEVTSQSKQTNIVLSSAVTTGAVTKGAVKLSTKNKRKQLNEIKSSYKQNKDDIKNNISQSKAAIKQAKKEYKKEIKDNKTQSNNNSDIKSSKSFSEQDKKNKDKKAEQQKLNKKSKERYNNIKNSEKSNIITSIKEYFGENKKIAKIKLKETKLNGGAIIIAIAVAMVIITVFAVVFVSPLGILFAEDNTEQGTYSLNSSISIVNQEFSDAIHKIEQETPHDVVSISNDGNKYTISNWQDILAIWDVKYCNESLIGVIDDNQLNNIRTVVEDMITVNYSVETIEKTVDEQTIQEDVLYINIEYKNVDEMANLYKFSKGTKEELNNLISSDDFLAIFRETVGDVVGGDNPPIIGTGKFIYPTITTNISAGYPNYSNGSYHGGVDFPVPTGSPIYAVDDGVVTTAIKKTTSYGYYITIDHGNGLSTLYAHNSELLVSEGQTVKQGDVIALSGSTGNATGPHCHFEVRSYGNRVNPMHYLK